MVKRSYSYQRNGVRIKVALKVLREVSPYILADLQEEASHLLKLRRKNLARSHGIVEDPAMMCLKPNNDKTLPVLKQSIKGTARP
ncbi:hypothetical protein KIN20_020348 [Parelaphostrongylus tenuis]|uniref:Uncharacterized protein n=1 Tax=Parelaphostrongylus tenuis TaxID=148309 RepID=A0AAD5N5T9_PARTN|nr:hypothetical protein KIN20_020348 [Parelaphostrongylus tenuis]